jgi:hypothetical protein
MESSTWSFISRLVSPPVDLDQAVGQRRFPVIDMGDDGEIADVGEIGHRRRGYTRRDRERSSRRFPLLARER